MASDHSETVFARADNLTQVEELADRMDWDEIKHDCRDYRQRQL